MKTMKNLNGMKLLKRMLLLCLCAALVCTAALAETDTVYLGPDQKEVKCLPNSCQLPDGRLVFSGHTSEKVLSENDNAYLLCLNRDMTVSWEYTEPDTKISGFGTMGVTKDGTIGVICYPNGDDFGIKFFTTEGQPLGDMISMPSKDIDRYEAFSFGMVRGGRSGEEYYQEFLDWEGNVLFRANQEETMWVGENLIQEEDGVVLYGGQELDGESDALLMKLDWKGNKVWETVLPALKEGVKNAYLRECVKTSDGGYLGYLSERHGDAKEREYIDALVKFSADGQIAWTKLEDADRDIQFSALAVPAEYNGMYVMQLIDWVEEKPDSPIRYLWLDRDGNELGITEQHLSKADQARISEEKMGIHLEEMYAMKDGLWQECFFWVDTDENEEEYAWARHDICLIRVPEL